MMASISLVVIAGMGREKPPVAEMILVTNQTTANLAMNLMMRIRSPPVTETIQTKVPPGINVSHLLRERKTSTPRLKKPKIRMDIRLEFLSMIINLIFTTTRLI